MKTLKTVKMQKVRNLILTNLFAVAGIVLVHFFFDIKWSNHGSVDIIIGALTEVLILGAYFEFINHRSQNNLEVHLQNHLRQIEKIIRSQK